MNSNEKETAHSVSDGADSGQSLSIYDTEIVSQATSEIKETAKIKHSQVPPRTAMLTVAELMAMELPPIVPIVENMLTPGLYIIAGAPKVGKSLLGLQLALHVGQGLSLWGLAVRRGTVLYCALEDSWVRVHERIEKMCGTTSLGINNVALTIDMSDFGPVDELISSFVAANTDTKLVIIDTFAKVRKSSYAGYNYSEDYAAVGALKELADSLGICILLVHHTRKMDAARVFEMVSGTQGITGAADGTLILMPGEEQYDAVLSVTGRDYDTSEFLIERDPETLLWSFVRDGHADSLHPDIQALLGFLDTRLADKPSDESELWSGSPSELSAAIHAHTPANALTKRINQARSVLNARGIKYDTAGGRTRRISFWTSDQPNADSKDN